MVEVDEGVGRPETIANLVAGDDFAGFFEQQGEDLERLVLQLDAEAVLAKFTGAQVEFVA